MLRMGSKKFNVQCNYSDELTVWMELRRISNDCERMEMGRQIKSRFGLIVEMGLDG